MGKSSNLLSRYVIKEFTKNFLVEFLFFFSIFFVNTILLLVQKILLKNISIPVMVEMVLLYMPQFLVYTFPFATLTASSMVLGDMASSNELLAIRSLGISSLRIYSPLVIASIIITILTFLTADVLQPYTSVIYRDKLAVLMAEMPTLEIESNGVNSVGNIILSNGQAEGNEIEDLLLISKGEGRYNEAVSSQLGSMNILDKKNFVYSLDLTSPSLLLTDSSSGFTHAYAEAESGRIFLDFSSQVPTLTSTSPVNLSSRDLVKTIEERNKANESSRASWLEEMEKNYMKISNVISSISRGTATREESKETIEMATLSASYLGDPPTNIYGQY